MSNTWDLKRLRESREEILKAELAAWLHDAGKLHSGHQSKYLRDKPRSNYTHTRFGPGGSKKFLETFSRSIPKSTICGALVDPERIIRNHHKAGRKNHTLDEPVVYLIQRMDWMDSEFDRSSIIWRGPQRTLIQPSSSGFGLFDVFGFERHLYKWSEEVEYTRTNQAFCDNQSNRDILLKWLCVLQQSLHLLSFEKLRKGVRTFLIWLEQLFSKAAGDSRYSVNDISLWEHSHSVSTFFKAFISWSEFHSLSYISNEELKNKVQNHSAFRKWFRPQLLPLRIDGLAYLTQSNNVPDLLARRALLQKVYDTWQDILEWEFPLAGEVYRDENGPVFLTFLRDQNGKHSIPLNALQLPIDDEQNAQGDKGQNIHILSEAYKKADNLEEYLRHAIVYLTQGDLTLRPGLELHTYAQKRSEDGKSLGDLLREERNEGLRYQPDVEKIDQSWNNKGEQREKCSICSLRPLGYGARNQDRDKAISRGMCGVCLERRESRAKPWAQGIHLDARERFLQGLPETVWLDEVADKHGRIALIVGYFPLENWLDGTLIESLAMFKRTNAKSPPTNREITVHDENSKPANVVLGPKPLSYSRIRRVWETTRRFWQDVAPTDAPPEELQKLLQGNKHGLKLEDLWEEGPLSLKDSLAGQAIGEERPRIFLKGELQQGSLGPYHAYELEIQGRKVAVLWVPEDAKDDKGNALPYRGGFWVIENLEYLDNVYGRRFQDLVQELAGQPLKVYEPTEYGRPGHEQATFTIARDDGVQDAATPYTPLIPILAEPRTFMALVPANKAFEVMQDIKAKYEREMGRVRNRLPLHLGVVFADSHQPLRTILDAGRRMLKRASPAFVGEVRNVKQFGRPNHPNETKGWRALRLLKRTDLLKQQPSQFRALIGVRIVDEQTHRDLIWYLPAVMGDGRTEDHWSPFVFWVNDKDGNTHPGKATKPRHRYYQVLNPFNLDEKGNPQPGWLVHAAELQPGDRIYFTPATFDFIFLDHGGRRFEIAYDEEGHRRGALHRPYLLDEIEDLATCWRLLAGEKRQVNGREEAIRRLSSRQLHQIRDLIETKRTEWFENPEGSLEDETFRRFCADVLQNAEWTTKPTAQELQRLTQWTVSGLLADAVELFYHIMKQRPVGEADEDPGSAAT